MNVGISCLLDFFGVEGDKFHDASYLETLLLDAVKIGKLTPLHSKAHQFNHILDLNHEIKAGATALIMLSESHISVHTWPEYGKLVFDLFSCGSAESTDSIIDYLIENVPHQQFTLKKIFRGDEV